MTKAPVPHALGGARGVRFGPLPQGLEALLAELMERAASERAETLKPGRVWAWGEWVIKRSEPLGWLDRFLRASHARRAAAAALRLGPVRSPRPLLALDERGAAGLRASWLVMERVRGEPIHTALKRDPRAVATFPAFMAAMHRHGVLHGDLNVQNALWDGSEWHLIDLDGLRGGLHRLRLRSAAELQWARIAGSLRDIAALRPMFEQYAALVGRRDVESAWRRIAARAALEAERYERILAQRRAGQA